MSLKINFYTKRIVSADTRNQASMRLEFNDLDPYNTHPVHLYAKQLFRLRMISQPITPKVNDD
jgi:hypothetical protein